MNAITSTILDFLDSQFPWFKEFHIAANQALDGIPVYYIILGLIVVVVLYFVIKEPFKDKQFDLF